ncbi:MAG: hypothetical protein Q8912_02615 [Bacillota bacterium]|nr:hypothetical protein [Bacillota bacterium]MDP4159021.1 hypothetical protein [Bacillota bacterium]
MAYFSGVNNVKRVPSLSGTSLARWVSLRSVTIIILILVACTALEFLVFWRPMYRHFRSLQTEKNHWQNVLQAMSVNKYESPKTISIPTMDQLPDIVDQCRSIFGKESVDVFAFNVERFGERQDAGKGPNLDYGLVRFRLRGQWEGIIRSLKVLEEMQGFSVQVQEVVLEAEGGETLLQIDFCTGMERNIPSNP